MTQRPTAECWSFDYPANPPVGSGSFFGSAAGTWNVQSTYARNGRRALRLQPTGAGGAFVDRSFSGSAQTNKVLGRFYVYFITLPNANCGIYCLMAAAGGAPEDTGIFWNNSTGKLYAKRNSVNGADGPSPSVGVWYRVDFILDADLSNTLKWQWAVDGEAGVDQPQPATGAAMANRDRSRFGSNANHSADYAVDDYVAPTHATGTYPAYPIGDGECFYRTVDGDGTHNNASDFTDDAANSPPAANMYQRLDEGPSTSVADFVYQDTTNPASYMEATLADIVASPNPNRMHGAVHRCGRSVPSAYSQTSLTVQAYSPDDGGNFGSFSVNGVTAAKTYPGGSLFPVGGDEAAFSLAKVNNGRLRFGFNADTHTDHRVHDYHQEWALAPTPTDLPYWDTVCV